MKGLKDGKGEKNDDVLVVEEAIEKVMLDPKGQTFEKTGDFCLCNVASGVSVALKVSNCRTSIEF